MKISFFKYQGTGNDFVMIDNRGGAFPKNDTSTIKRLCDRRFGIGGDGLILLENDKNADFRMVYFNSDGNQSSMCGNGGRCIVAFARQLGIVTHKAEFIAVDGPHWATIDNGLISLGMKDVDEIKPGEGYHFLDTGSPHHVALVKDLQDFPVKEAGAAIRYGSLYGTVGCNVNFVEAETDIFSVRTYERGVEDETYSCGTGVTAVAIAMHASGKTESESIKLKTPGGMLEVSFSFAGGKYRNVTLKGPAELVFSGEIEI